MKKQLILFGIFGLILFLSLTKTGRKIVTTSIQKITDIGINLVAKFEGFSDKVYLDEAGIWTIGYGHKIYPGEVFYPYGTIRNISVNEAKILLANDMEKASSVVKKYVKVPLTENQFNSLVSFVFNTSSNDEHLFANSTLLRKLNSGDYVGAANELKRWVYVTKNGQKVVSNGLIARRETERNLFIA